MNLLTRDKNFYKAMLAIAIPMSMQSLISFCVNLIDTLMLGKLGEIALSASALGGSFCYIISTVCMGLGGGAGVITAQYWGKKDLNPIRTMTAICIKITVLFGVVLSVLTALFPTAIMRIYTSDAQVIAAGADYVRTLSFSLLLYGLTSSITMILRSVGIVQSTLIASIGACFVNVFFNWIFIFGKLGCPAMGIVGAAWGTNCARLFEFLVIFIHLLFVDKKIGFRVKHLKLFDSDIFRRFIKAGIPVLISDLVFTLGNQLVTIIVGHCGALFTAANSIAGQVSLVLHALFIGVANSSSTLVGNAVGAGDYKRAYDEGKTYLILCLILGCVMACIMAVLKGPVVNFFNVSEETKLYANQMLTIQVILLVITPMGAALSKGILRGGGDTKFLIFGDTFSTYAVVPFGILTAFVLDCPIWVIYLVLKSEMFLRFTACFIRFLSKKWIKNVTLEAGVKAVSLEDSAE